MVGLLPALPPWAYPLPFHRGPLPGEPAGARFLQVQEARVRYRDEGQGPAVVLLHGFSSALEVWDAVVPALAREWRVVALDLKGFGWTDRPPGDYSPQAQARLVLALMDRLGVERATLVGHSWGASVALCVALAAPARVERLALYSAWAFEEQLPDFFRLARLPGLGEWLFTFYYGVRPLQQLRYAFHDPRHVTPALVASVEAALARPGARAAALAAARSQRYRLLQGRYRTLPHPTLLLWGEEDRVSLPSYARLLARELPRATLHTFPRCGHFPMLEVPGRTLVHLRRFLREGRSPPWPARRTTR